MTADPYARLDAVYLPRRDGATTTWAAALTPARGSSRQRHRTHRDTDQDLQITQPNGPAILAWFFRTAIASRPAAGSLARHMRICVRGGTRRAR